MYKKLNSVRTNLRGLLIPSTISYLVSELFSQPAFLAIVLFYAQNTQFHEQQSRRKKRYFISDFFWEKKNLIQSTLVIPYPDNSDLRLIRMHLRPLFCKDLSNIIRLIRISHYSYYFVWSLVIRMRRIQLYEMFAKFTSSKSLRMPIFDSF